MHTSHHVYHWGSWAGTGLAIWGVVDGDVVREYTGVVIAILFSVVSATVYVRQLLYADQLKRSAAREQYRRDQELLEAKHKADLEQVTHAAQG